MSKEITEEFEKICAQIAQIEREVSYWANNWYVSSYQDWTAKHQMEKGLVRLQAQKIKLMELGV